VWGRIFVRASSHLALPVLARVFGISSISFIERVVEADLDTIVAEGTELFREAVAGKSFAVRARRAGGHTFRSLDIEKQLGAALLPFSAGVDLSNPDVTAYVEVRN